MSRASVRLRAPGLRPGLGAAPPGLPGPTTGDADRKVAARLAEASGLDVDEFGLEVLRAGDDLLIAEPGKIWKRDQKVFSIRNRRFAVAQLETVSLESLPPERLDAFRARLAADFESEEYLLSLLFLTDILQGRSWVTACESAAAKGVVKTCFGANEPRPGWTLAQGIVSRKQQIIPRLMQALAECRL